MKEKLKTTATSFNVEFKVGVFVLFGIISFLGALLTMTDPGTFRNRYYIHTFLENAGGLRKGDPVQMKGVNIGRVKGFEITEEGVKTKLELSGEYALPSDSYIRLVSAGILGGKIIEIVPGVAQEKLSANTLRGTASSPNNRSSIESMGFRADTLLSRAQQILSPETVGNLQESTTTLTSTLSELNQLAQEQRKQLFILTESLNRSATAIERGLPINETRTALARIDSITRRIDNAATSLERSTSHAENILARVEKGEGTLGKLSTDPSLYNNLNNASHTLNTLLIDIKAHPEKFFKVRVF